ncbi:MAG: DUF3533 domain-containing protein [Cellulomonadaceae bacterium]
MTDATAGRWAAFRSGPWLPASVLVVILTVMATCFAVSYSLALTDPEPRHVPVAVVGVDADHTAVARDLVGIGPGSYAVRTADSLQQALDGVDHFELYGILDTDNSTLYVSSASGALVAQSLRTAAQSAELGDGSLQVVDLHPLPTTDPMGTSMFYMALAAVIIGFVGAMQVNVHAKGLSLRARVLWELLISLTAPLAIVVTVGPVLGIVPIPVLPAWGILAMTMFSAAMVCSAAQVMFHRWALLPVWTLFVLVANPSSGGAVAPPLLPPFYAFIGRFLPTGAGVQGLRTVTYFDAVPWEQLAVLVAWGGVFCLLYVVLRRRAEHRARARTSVAADRDEHGAAAS